MSEDSKLSLVLVYSRFRGNFLHTTQILVLGHMIMYDIHLAVPLKPTLGSVDICRPCILRHIKTNILEF